MSDSFVPEYERERRFLVAEKSIVRGASWEFITQGYFFAQDGYALRVRLTEKPTNRTGAFEHVGAKVTAKGPRIGDERAEYETEMDPLLAAEFIARCSNVIRKRRYHLVFEKQIWEIDEFLEKNEGLWIAELEGKDIRDVPVPPWALREITSNTQFNNDEIAFKPVSEWDGTDWKAESPWDWN
jgi:adenylate cyclase